MAHMPPSISIECDNFRPAIYTVKVPLTVKILKIDLRGYDENYNDVPMKKEKMGLLITDPSK